MSKSYSWWWIQDIFDEDGFSHPSHGEEDVILMQYTGLKDKNGKEIYEGDIIKSIANGYRYVVVFRNGIFRMKSIGSYMDIATVGFTKHEPFVIIGNIFENPELLENL